MSAVSNVLVIYHRPSYIQGVKIRQAYNFELMPNGKQKHDMCCFAGCRRFVFNRGLAMQKEHYQNGKKFIYYEEMAKDLTLWRHDPETSWLLDAPCHPLQHALKDLKSAFKNFFEGRAEYPVFKKKGINESFRYPDKVQIKLDEANSRICLPKLGWIRYRNSRKVLGEVRNVTVKSRAGKWFIAIQTERDVKQPVPTATKAAGIDLGITRFATLSDASFIEPLNSFKNLEDRLAHYQREMARKIKFSKNWIKAKAKVQKVHHDIANARKEFLHKNSTTISKNHAFVSMENLQVKNMSKSSKGNSEVHGRMVKQKSGLNRRILDQGWGEFRRQIEYKLSWNGGIFVAVPPHYTSQKCPKCGHTSKENRLTQAKFLCVSCTYEENADVVGAMNILAAGHAVLACGEMTHVGPSLKQEPAEVTT
jgi:putative transposase